MLNTNAISYASVLGFFDMKYKNRKQQKQWQWPTTNNTIHTYKPNGFTIIDTCNTKCIPHTNV